jgi:hypothetical protein
MQLTPNEVPERYPNAFSIGQWVVDLYPIICETCIPCQKSSIWEHWLRLEKVWCPEDDSKRFLDDLLMVNRTGRHSYIESLSVKSHKATLYAI